MPNREEVFEQLRRYLENLEDVEDRELRNESLSRVSSFLDREMSAMGLPPAAGSNSTNASIDCPRCGKELTVTLED